MTATPILESLAREFKTSPDHVRAAFEMLDAGLTAPFIGRFRRASVGSLSESMIRRLERRRDELTELDRRRGTIARLLEREPNVGESVLQSVQRCMDRFELEDLFLPHRRPEPEVQLALDRGLGNLAEALIAPLPRPEGAPAEESEEGADEDSEEHEEHPSHEAEVASGATDAAEHQHEDLGAALDAATSESKDAEPAADEPDAVEERAPHAASEIAAPVVHEEPSFAPREALTPDVARECAAYVSPDRGVHNEIEALEGAMRILADRLGRNARLRGALRRMMRKHGVLSVRPTVDEGKAGRFRSLLKTNQPMRQLQGHRLLAIRQAQKERVLATRITIDERQALAKVRGALGKHLKPAFAGVIDEICRRALVHRLLPMIEDDIRLELKERADSEALRFLSQHLRQLLLTPHLARPLPVAGLDVNAKGDWTIVVVDELGAPTSAQAKLETSGKDAAALGQELATLLAPGPGREDGVPVIAVGNGKSPRAAVTRLRECLATTSLGTVVLIVTEAGLSSYANSEIARRELEEASVPARMAISLARRLQDPISELLKVDPRHLGLGSEQGLVSKANVRRTFRETVESCTAHVGCDVNRASLQFLSHLPGLGREAAGRIVARRVERPIGSRAELRDEGILDEAQWTSAIAFLRVYGSPEALDRTNLHPEQYPLARRILESVAGSVDEGLGRPPLLKGLKRQDFEVEEETWRDLSRELAWPGRDPRLRIFRPGFLRYDTSPASVEKGSVVEGIVSNVASFGAFVDVGLPQDAMVHISEISDRYVRDARELLSVGQLVRARVVETGGQRMTLSLKNVPREVREPVARRPEARQRGERRGGDRRGEGSAERGPKVNPNLRAAQTRRDGLGGTPSGGRRGFGGPGGRGRRERSEPEERVNLKEVNRQASQAAHNPFAAFFRSSEEVEAGAEGDE